MSLCFIVLCSKKKSEKDSKVLPSDESSYGGVKSDKKKKKKKNKVEPKAEDQNNVQKVPDENEKLKSGEKSKSKSRKVKTKTTQEADSSSRKKKKSTISKATTLEVQNEVKANTRSGKTQNIGLDGDVIPAELCGKMDKTIVEVDNPAIHDRVTRVAESDLIFDPKVIKYQGNVDNEKNKSEIEALEKEMEAACAQHEKRNRNPNKKSEDSKESLENVPADRRVKMKPEACLLFETKEQQTEEDEIHDVQSSTKKKQGFRYNISKLSS
ncbi:Protein CBG18102 [Caenorhabditis briggsae]|uniref:Protein CBG18102 n=1 Tax=Caenorhabditis briggsae TaxID=6238 RepID=A8XT13_CAEBR|nr:Protein CBG18102 [Caenorhabditis briggsae]CAP35616.2 Protein CBG18102 [Caenorhabditis briggsae]